MNNTFKTVRKIDGKDYVELEEVTQVLEALADSEKTITNSVSRFEKAVQDLQNAFKAGANL